MKKKIYLFMFLISIFTMILSAAVSVGVIYNSSLTAVKKELGTQANFFSKVLSSGDLSYLDSIGTETPNRITLIQKDGTVLYDNYLDEATLSNHIERPEITQAIQNGSGQAIRRSDSVGKQTYYYALRLDNGNILRLSDTMDSIFGLVLDTLQWELPLLAGILLLSLAVSHTMAASIINPLNKLDLNAPLNNNTYEELSPLLVRLEKQNRRIDTQIQLLSEKQSEMEAITAGMREGLVILNNSGAIVSVNKSALHIFGLSLLPQEESGAKSYLSLCRNLDYIKAAEAALEGKSSTTLLHLGGRCYRLSAGSVEQEGAETGGAVLFLADVTEKEAAETMRREFTANVSHELKTPLTSIMGYGEIIENRVARPKDISAFAGKIRAEAGRLLTLIEDILKLSQLDEGVSKENFTPVNLYQVACEAVEELRPMAAKLDVSLEISGTPCIISGIAQTLHETVYNLCDNAIKYNRPGGHVWVTVAPDSSLPERTGFLLTVKDDGIGIPEADQARVFERFYRVDKSHSKQTGGTGLGLSIVKHAVLLHGGNISLKSQPGSGTEITVSL